MPISVANANETRSGETTPGDRLLTSLAINKPLSICISILLSVADTGLKLGGQRLQTFAACH